MAIETNHHFFTEIDFNLMETENSRLSWQSRCPKCYHLLESGEAEAEYLLRKRLDVALL